MNFTFDRKVNEQKKLVLNKRIRVNKKTFFFSKVGWRFVFIKKKKKKLIITIKKIDIA